MKNEMPKWKEKSTYEKGLTVLSKTLSILVILFATIYLTGMWQSALSIAEPLLGLVMFVQALQFRKYNRFISVLSLISSLFILIVSIVVFFFI
jgi:uncharacterized membrane protein YkgB